MPDKPVENSILKLAIVSLLIAVGAYALKFIFNVVLSRHLGKTLYGDFSLGRMMMSLVGVLVLLGTATSSKKFFSKCLAMDDDHHEASSSFVTWNLRLMLLSFCFLLALLLILTVVTMLLHLFEIKRFETYHLAFYMLWLAPILGLTILLTSYLRCNKNLYWSNVLGGAGFYFIGLLLFIPAIYFLEISMDFSHLFLFVFGILVILLFLDVFLANHYMPSILFNGAKNIYNEFGEASHNDKKHWRMVSFTLVLNQVIFSTVCMIDIVMVELFANSEAKVGEYAACLTVWGLQFLLTNQVFSTFSYRISSLIDGEENKKILQRLISSGQTLNLTISAVVFIVICVFAKPILSTFGAHFETASLPLIILAVGGLISALIGPCASLLAYAGSEKSMLLISLFQFIILLALGVPFTIYFGIVGTASAGTASILFKSIVMQRMVKKRLGLRMWFVI
jgi:O-antigen/teichoic acid export membrane protein